MLTLLQVTAELTSSTVAAAGKDTLAGGNGSDTYIISNDGITVKENAGLNTGTDLVKASVDYTLTDNVENLTLTGSDAVSGTGNTSANLITGNTAANVIDGGGGADTLKGGKGDDTYIVDNSSVKITEDAKAGTDLGTSKCLICAISRN